MLNEVIVAKVAKALGIPEEQNEFVWEYCFTYGFTKPQGGIDYEGFVKWCVTANKTWEDVQEDAAKARVVDLERQLEAAEAVAVSIAQDLQYATPDKFLALAKELEERAETVDLCNTLIINICKDFPNSKWAQNHLQK